MFSEEFHHHKRREFTHEVSDFSNDHMVDSTALVAERHLRLFSFVL